MNFLTKEKLLDNIEKGLTLSDISLLNNCSRTLVYKYIRLYKIDLPKRILTCGCCKKVFAIDYKTKTSNRKFCSKQCREKKFYLDNPEKRKKYSRKYLLSKQVICRCCLKPIPHNIRKTGLTYCSDKCRKNQHLLRTKENRRKINSIFNDFKQEIGCFICKYNKYGCSIDFHHIDPCLKEKRITSYDFYLKTKTWEEVNKCILCCKNCHNELHDILRRDKNEYKLIIDEIISNNKYNLDKLRQRRRLL